MSQIQELALPPIDRVPDLEQGSIFFIGTATVLLRCARKAFIPRALHTWETLPVSTA